MAGNILRTSVLVLGCVLMVACLAVLLQQLKPCNCHDEENPSEGAADVWRAATGSETAASMNGVRV
jgi:hypothetical protein